MMDQPDVSKHPLYLGRGPSANNLYSKSRIPNSVPIKCYCVFYGSIKIWTDEQDVLPLETELSEGIDSFFKIHVFK